MVTGTVAAGPAGSKTAAMVHHPEELPDRDPLVTDLLEVEGDPAPEEAALHIVAREPSYDEHELDDVFEELAVEDPDERAVDERE